MTPGGRKPCLIVIGGYNVIKSVQVWDIGADQMIPRALPDLPVGRSSGGAAMINNEIYYIGGRSRHSGNVDSIYKLTLSSKKWDTVASMSKGRLDMTAVTLHDNIYILGGQSNGGCVATNERYNVKKNRVEVRAPLPRRLSGTAGCVLDEVIFISGGCQPDYTVSDDIFSYQETSDLWSHVGNMNTARYSHMMCAADSVIFIMGGIDGTRLLDSMESFDPVKGQCTRLTTPMMKELGTTIAVYRDGHIYIAAGTSGDLTDEIRSYNIQEDRWQQCAARLHEPTFNCACVLAYLPVQ